LFFSGYDLIEEGWTEMFTFFCANNRPTHSSATNVQRRIAVWHLPSQRKRQAFLVYCAQIPVFTRHSLQRNREDVQRL